jgi:hypothetical protein
MAVSEDLFDEILTVMLDERVTTLAHENAGDFGPFTAGYDIEGHFEPGSIDLRDDPDQVKLSELDVVWDTFDLSLAIDIPEICIGGFCIIPTPFGCALRAPKICVFEGGPEIDFTLPLGGTFRSELSVLGEFTIAYGSYREPGDDYLDAQAREATRLEQLAAHEAAGTDPPDSLLVPKVNSWDVSVSPETVDIDLIDVADTVGDLLEDALDAALDSVLDFLPGWARDVLRAIFGSFIDIVRTVLDIGDDIGEWLSDLIGVSLDLLGFLVEVLYGFFVDNPVFRIEDPYPVLEADVSFDPPLIPVKIPIEDLVVDVEETEIVLQANVGA